MKEKKILFKHENGTNNCDIKNVSTEELLAFICGTLEQLIEHKVVTRDLMLTSINMYLTIGSRLSKEDLENKEIEKLIDELSDSMLNSFRSITND